MAPFHSLRQHNQKEMHHDIFGYVMPLAPSSEENHNQAEHDFLVMCYQWYLFWYPMMPKTSAIP